MSFTTKTVPFMVSPLEAFGIELANVREYFQCGNFAMAKSKAIRMRYWWRRLGLDASCAPPRFIATINGKEYPL